jgi:hypothetical protein
MDECQKAKSYISGTENDVRMCPQITVNCEICLFCLIETPCKSLKFNKMTLNSKKVVNWGLQNYLSRYHDPIGNKN